MNSKAQVPYIRRQSSLIREEQKKNVGSSKINELKKEIYTEDHKINLDELLAVLKTDAKFGLTQTKAQELLEKNGPNKLTPPKEIPEWVKYLKQMTNGFAILLWIGALFSIIAFLINNSQDPEFASKSDLWLGIVLIFVVVVTGTFQYYQEVEK